MQATLSKEERLSSLKEIETLVNKGKSLFHYPFKVSYLSSPIMPESESIVSVLISVPKRNFKRAVKRNLLKRRVRESYRVNKQILSAPENHKVNIMFVYVSKQITESSFIEVKVKEILEKINGALNQPKCQDNS